MPPSSAAHHTTTIASATLALMQRYNALSFLTDTYRISTEYCTNVSSTAFQVSQGTSNYGETLLQMSRNSRSRITAPPGLLGSAGRRDVIAHSLDFTGPQMS
jgi:hypothetical protein